MEVISVVLCFACFEWHFEKEVLESSFFKDDFLLDFAMHSLLRDAFKVSHVDMAEQAL